MKTMKQWKKTVPLSLLLLLSYAVRADVIDTIGGVNNLLYGVAAGIAALMITINAIRWKTASSPADREEAKRGIINVILGLIIIIIATALVGMIYLQPEIIDPGSNTTVNCDMLDGWYVKKALGPTCIGSDACADTVEKVQRDYSPSGTGCSYVEVSTRTECSSALVTCPAGQTCTNGLCTGGGAIDCNALDGWYTVKSNGPLCVGTQLCTEMIEKVERDYYNNTPTTCAFTEKGKKTECTSSLKDCPASQVCTAGVCVGSTPASSTTRRVTTTRKPTSTSSTSTTTTTTSTTTTLPDNLLTAKKLVDCIRSRGGIFHTLGAGCGGCVAQEGVFNRETGFPDGSTGAGESPRLTRKGSGTSPTGSYPNWEWPSQKNSVGCKTFPELSAFFNCALVNVPGHTYEICK